MRIPTLQGVIDRRILANYRVDPDRLAAELPAPFRPKIVRGFGVAGLCLIRLKHVRPRGLPGWIGLSSENAAHRIAVEWDDGDRVRDGVYIRRRDTSSRWNAWAGGTLFPGIHHRGEFEVDEAADRFALTLRSDDRTADLSLRALRARGWSSSLFDSVNDASEFFRAGSLGFSPGSDPGRVQGLELRCTNWDVEPLAVDEICSAYFDDVARFPVGAIQFDNALLMRGIAHEWHGRGEMCCETGRTTDLESASRCGIPAESRH